MSLSPLLLNKKNNSNKNPDFRTPEGFKKAFDLYAPKVYAICRGQIQRKEVAEEIVQDIFRSLWERRDSLVLKEPLEHYLFRAAKLKVIDYYRQKQRNEKHIHCALEDYCFSHNCTEEAVAFNELQQQIAELVDMLPCHCRQVYQLSREEGLSHKEIATVLNISVKTVEYHLKKAITFLKGHLNAA